MTDEEKIRALDIINQYVHKINNSTLGMDLTLGTSGPMMGSKGIKSLKVEINRIKQNEIDLRLDLVKLFCGNKMK